MTKAGARRRGSVRLYLATGFGVCLAGLVAITATITIASFDRERARATEQLRSIAQSVADDWEGQSTDSFLLDLAEQPLISSLDPADCRAGLDPLHSVTSQARIHVVRSNGSEVCRLQAPGPHQEFVAGPEIASAEAGGDPVFGGPAIDPVTGYPSFTLAVGIEGPNGRGALVAVLRTDDPPIVVPRNTPKQAALVLTDAGRTMVLARAGSSPAKTGQLLAGTALAERLPAAGRTLTDIDGRSRIYVEVPVDAYGFRAFAGLPPDIALADARRQLVRTAALDLALIGLVVGLALLMHRGLARPIRRLEQSIRAAIDDDTAPPAPVAGPSEVAGVAAAFNDLLDERRSLEDDLRHRARHDPLTDLPNRLHVTEELTAALAEGNDVAVLFLDLDRFKLINDSHGHAVGDRLLVALAGRLTATTEDCLVSRFGGDEFVIVCRGATKTDAVAEAERISLVVKTPFRIGGQELFVNGSIGISLSRSGDGPDDLIRNADTAMYRAKDSGRGRWAIFDDEMRAWSVNQLRVESDLHRALARGEFELHYQPKVSVVTNGIVGVEALVRWRHPERGLISPAKFIGVAEETGLIIDVGAWVLGEAARQAAAWRLGGTPLTVSVNLAARQLGLPDLPAIVADVVRDAGALPSEILLEITESAVLEDADVAGARLEQLRAAGFGVSIDDFGTGYSSLSYLQMLPIDELKVDRAFVSRLGDDNTTIAIVGAVVDLAHAIGLSVVAEGVEEPAQLAALLGLGCDLAQGFLLARPAPAATIDALVADWPVRAAT